MKKRRFVWQLVPLLWLAWALRVWRLDAQSLWYDEGYSVYLGSHLALDQALDLTVRDIVPPLYYLLLRGWLPFTGTSEYALRFLSVLLGVVAVALLARIGRHLAAPLGKRAETTGGLLSAALATIAPVLIWLSQDARMYGPLITASLLSSWGLLRATAPAAPAPSRRRGWTLFVVAGLAALYTHTVAVFWLLGQLAFGLWEIGGSWLRARQNPFKLPQVREGLIAGGMIGLGYLPWLIVAANAYQVNTGYWPGHLPPPYLWRTAWNAFVGGQHLSPAHTDLAAALFCGVALSSWALLLLKIPRTLRYLFCYLTVPLLAMGFAFQHTPKLAARYPTPMAPALVLTVAMGIATFLNFGVPVGHNARPHISVFKRLTRPLFNRGVPLLALLGVVSLSLRADANLYFDPHYGKDDWRAAAEYIQAHRTPDEVVLLVSGHTFPVFAYYYGWEGWQALPQELQLDVTHVLHYPEVQAQLNAILSPTNQAAPAVQYPYAQGVSVQPNYGEPVESTYGELVESTQSPGGVWLVLWQENVVDPTGLVPALLGDVGQELTTPLLHGTSDGDRVKLRHFKLPAPVCFASELPLGHADPQPLAPGLLALGYTLPSVPLPADAEIPIRVFWQAQEPLRGAYAASLRLYDRMGQEWDREDELLSGPWYFTERWTLDTPVMGQYTLTLPLGTPPGVLTPTLTVYRDQETFGTLQFSSLVITRPLHIPALSALPSAGFSPPLSIPDDGKDAEVTLVGVGFDQHTVTPCQNWALSLAWRTASTPTHAYRLLLRAGPHELETTLSPDYTTERWQPGEIWRTRHQIPIHCRALDGVLAVSAQLLRPDGQPLGHPIDLGQVMVDAGRSFTCPQDLTARIDAQLVQVGTLLGYRLEKDRTRPVDTANGAGGENLKVTLYWRAGHETDYNYSVFVHLEDVSTGQVWAQHDGWPVAGQKPTSTWAQGEVIADLHVISVGQDVPAGDYRLVVGMYDAKTLQTLAAWGPDGQVIENGRIVLQRISIPMDTVP